MRERGTIKRFAALMLSLLMVLSCIPMSAMAEDTVIPDESISVEVISDDAEILSEQEIEQITEPDASAITESSEVVEEEPQALENIQDQEAQEVEQTSEPDLDDEVIEEQPVSEAISADEPETDSSIETEPEITESVSDDRHPLQAAIDTYGHIYVSTVRNANVFSSSVLDADTLVFSTTNDVFLLLATEFTEQKTVMVWFLDVEGNVVNGYVSAKDLDDKFLLDEDIKGINFLPMDQGMTAIGMMSLFLVNGAYPDETAEDQPMDQPVEEDPVESQDELAVDEPVQETEPVESELPDEIEPVDEPLEIPADEPTTEPEQEEIPEVLPAETDEPQEETPEPPEEPAHDAAGSYVNVTTKTRVFANIDSDAVKTYYSGEYLGNFVKDATVQILTVNFDETGGVWYQVRYLYGDDFADGRMKWTDYGTAWIMADETDIALAESCTVTDYAYTIEYLQKIRSGGRKKLMAASPMNGFSLKNISGQVGGFYAWQSGLYGSSGRDSAYPQIAKSASHGVVYATPHYLEGFTVYCLEHNLSGPGEGSGSSQSAKGPYVLVDMDTFVNNPSYGGTTGVRYKASTMHALGWVLRHSYPFMALNRSDSNNEIWSRVAGQFAMREVIKRLEGAQYVRSYWDMDNFYDFSDGAPAVYLEYARWLAANGIARASITGNITAYNQSLSVSGSNYIGKVTLITDADLIRIPKSVGTLTGNSGGSDSSYYYARSGDTIQVTSAKNKFAIPMESLASSDEEANFLVGVPSVSIQKILVPVYGAPNTLKSGSVSFELSYGEIAVTKKSSDGILLKGTVFELLNSAGSVITTATTNAKGVATFSSLQPGTYTVREKTASQGYKLASASQNVSVVAGVTAKVTFTNDRISGRIRIIKKDSVTEKPLPGAVFTVTRLSGPESDNASDIGKVVATITTNAQGIAETGLLPWGEYKIIEAGVPDGYLDSGYTTTVWIK